MAVKEWYKAYCKDAIEIQMACNPVAIIHSWHRHLEGAIDKYPGGWDAVIKDAPFILFVDKLNDMAGRKTTIDYGKAYNACIAVVDDV